MTTDLSKAQLATLLSTLDGAPRKPANRDAALRALSRSAERLGLSAEAVLAAAPDLLEGRLDAAAWRAGLAGAELTPVAPAADDLAQATSEPDREPPAASSKVDGAAGTTTRGERIAASLRVAFPELPEGLGIVGSGERAELVDRLSNWVMLVAERDDGATHAKWRKALARIEAKLAANKPIAPGDPRVQAAEPAPTDLASENAVLRARIAELEQRLTARARPARSPREPGATLFRDGTKQAQVIAMLRRPEGAVLAQIVEATGWLPHTARAVVSSAIGKKLGLTVTSAKDEQGRRVYRIVGSA